MTPTIRHEATTDHEAIRHVNRVAFGQDDEAEIVDALRAGGYARVSLVAEVNGAVVGHILFSDLPILTDSGTVLAMSLAPMAVLPEFQKRGIGSALVRKGLEACRNQGHRIVVVLGHSHFYPRFGFSAKLAESLSSPFGGRDSWMAMELVPGALEGVSGRVRYPPPFGIRMQVRGNTVSHESHKALGFEEGNRLVHFRKVLSDSREEGTNRSEVMPRLRLLGMAGSFAVCKLGTGLPIPPWATMGDLFSVTRTADELSVVCRQEAVPEGVICERDWRCLRVSGSMPFTLVGVLASLTTPVAQAGVSVFAFSTFDTDYLLVKANDMPKAVAALRAAGHLMDAEGVMP